MEISININNFGKMKKLLLILLSAIPILVNSQNLTKTNITARNSMSIGDSTVTNWYSGVLPNEDRVQDMINSGATVATEYDSLLFNPDADNSFSNPYKLFGNGDLRVLSYYRPNADFVSHAGEEAISPVINLTGDTLFKGTPISGDTADLASGVLTVRRAYADSLEQANFFIGIAENDIYPDSVGIAIRYGAIFYNTSSWEVKDQIWVCADTCALTNVMPSPPAYPLLVGSVLIKGNPGVIGINTQAFSGSDTDVNWQGAINGIVTNKPDLFDTVISNVPYMDIFNAENNNKNLPFMIDNTRYLLNTTDNSGKNGAARVQLQFGTDTLPLKQYVYIENWATTPSLAVSTSGYPEGSPRVVAVATYSQAKHESDGFAYVRRINNAVDGSDANGIISKITKRIRLLGSIITNGVEPTVEIVTSGGLDTLKVSTTSGIGYQLNSQVIEALEPPYVWANSPNGGDSTINSLSEINVAADGTSLRSNNSRYRINLFVKINSGDYPCQLVAQVSNGTYATDQNCVDDVGTKSVTTPPNYANDICVRYIAIPIRYTTSNGGTIINLIDLLEGGTGGYQNELNFPFGFGGVGSSASTGSGWPAPDATSTFYNSTDPTKTGAFDLSPITTGTNRTLSWPDRSGTIATEVLPVLEVTDTIKLGTTLRMYEDGVYSIINDVKETSFPVLYDDEVVYLIAGSDFLTNLELGPHSYSLGVSNTRGFSTYPYTFTSIDTLSLEFKVAMGSTSAQRYGLEIRADSSVFNNLLYANDGVRFSDGTIQTTASSTLTTDTISVNTTYYISETGSDQTGDGSIGTPWATILHALKNTADVFNAASVTYQVDTGNYDFTAEEISLMNNKQLLNGSEINLLGTYEAAVSSISFVRNSDTLFKHHASGQTWTVDEYKEHMILLGENAYPIYSNGADYVICAYDGSLGTASIYEYRTNLNLPAADVTIQPYIEDGSYNIKYFHINTIERLTIASGSPLGSLAVSDNLITCEQLNIGNGRFRRNYINTEAKAIVVQGSRPDIYNTVISGPGTNYGIQVQTNNSVVIQDIIADGFTKVLDQGVSFSQIKLQGYHMYYNTPLAYELDEGTQLSGDPTIWLNNVDYLYTSISDMTVFAVFDTANLQSVPDIAYVQNDDGQRLLPENNYIAYIKGVHTIPYEVQDTAIRFNQQVYTAVDTLPTSGSITVDCNGSNTFVCYMTGNITALDVENFQPGGTYIVHLYQGATGGYSITLNLTPDAYLASGSEDFSTTADDVNVLQFTSDGTNIHYSNAVFTLQP